MLHQLPEFLSIKGKELDCGNSTVNRGNCGEFGCSNLVVSPEFQLTGSLPWRERTEEMNIFLPKEIFEESQGSKEAEVVARG